VELINGNWIRITVWGDGKEAYSNKLRMRINNLLQEYCFKKDEYARKIGDKLVSFISLVIEAASKGATKALIETGAGIVSQFNNGLSKI
jgi:hypothetical protein